VKDRYGLSWQIIPTAFVDMISDSDPVKVKRVIEAMFTMKKLDIAALQKAYAGEQAARQKA
jgi:predicted 3-demethylubiquinone-9 3-methyltransferase (glyoxalase superfamily)